MSINPNSVMVMGARGLAQAALQSCLRTGTQCHVHFNRPSGHYGCQKLTDSISYSQHSNPCSLAEQHQVDLVIPMSIDWHMSSWKDQLLAQSSVHVFSPHGEAIRIEQERAYGMEVARSMGVAVPDWYVARTRKEALRHLQLVQRPLVIKNPFCSSDAPLNTIVSTTVKQTENAIRSADDTDGIFLQELIGKREVGHIALVANGEVIPLVTNQEYRWLQHGSSGAVDGNPLGGIVQADLNDEYGLAENLIHPLKDWLRETKYSGPLQVTAGYWGGQWQVMEYNVRIGVTTGPLMMSMLENPMEVFFETAKGGTPKPKFRKGYKFGVILGIVASESQKDEAVPSFISGRENVLWGDVTVDSEFAKIAGTRPFELTSFGQTIEECRAGVYANTDDLKKLGFQFRNDIGLSLWPPGKD